MNISIGTTFKKHSVQAQLCQLFCNPLDYSCQAPLSIRFFRQEYWSELPYPPPGDLPDPVIEPAFPMSTALQADSLPAEPFGEVLNLHISCHWF